jgi:hypothetical protein
MNVKSLISKMSALATAAAAACVLTPASAASAATNTTGSVGRLNCGWYAADNSSLPGLPYKVTTAILPTVTGTSNTAQWVWAHVNFGQLGNDGNVHFYRNGWFYTGARYGAVSGSWTSYGDGRSGYKTVDDAAGESGFASGDGAAPFTYVRVDVYWQSPSDARTTIGSYSAWEQNVRAVNYGPYVCNSGANYA